MIIVYSWKELTEDKWSLIQIWTCCIWRNTEAFKWDIYNKYWILEIWNVTNSKCIYFTYSPARTPKLQLTAEQLSTGEYWIPLKKDTTHPRAEEKPQQDSRRGEIAFRIDTHTCQRCSEVCIQGPRAFTETEPDWPLSVWVSPMEAWVSSGLTWGQGLWLQQTWDMKCVT